MTKRDKLFRGRLRRRHSTVYENINDFLIRRSVKRETQH